MLCYFSVVVTSMRPIARMQRKLQKSWASHLPSHTKDAEGKPLAMAGFPYHALDTYLPKLIRAGERVAICDQLEAPKRTTEEISPSKVENPQQEQNNSSGIHR